MFIKKVIKVVIISITPSLYNYIKSNKIKLIQNIANIFTINIVFNSQYCKIKLIPQFCR